MGNGNEQKIIDKILSDAKADADNILNKAKTEADSITNAAKDKAAKETAAYMELAKAEADKAASKEISGAEMKAKMLILSCKQELLSSVIDKAKAKLLALKGKEYENVISIMIDNAEEGGEIIFSEKDKKSLSKVAEEKGRKVSDEARDITGGFIVKKGDVEYNYTFESIVAVEREPLEQKAAEILFA